MVQVAAGNKELLRVIKAEIKAEAKAQVWWNFAHELFLYIPLHFGLVSAPHIMRVDCFIPDHIRSWILAR